MNGLYTIFKKVGGWALLNQWRKAGVLSYGMLQVGLTGISRKSLELVRLGVQFKIQKKLRKKYLPILKRFDKEWTSVVHSKSEHTESKVWICWLQGMEQAPDLVQRCYASIKEHIQNREIVLITSDNRNEYVQLPDYIEQKYREGIISHTHFSDILRVALLAEYGGTWIDATVYCTGGVIPRYMLDSDFFVFQNLKPGVDGHVLNISSWFMTARANNKLVLSVEELLYEYWQRNDILIDYFLIHHFFAMAGTFYATEWQKIVPFSNSIPHILQLRLFETYNQECYDEIRRICPFHKLTYKYPIEKLTIKGTYYDVILGNGQTQ